MQAIQTPDENQRAAFDRAVRRALEGAPAPTSIGLLGEKTLHRAVKLFLEPDPARHEQKVGRQVADILTADGAVEVQTRGFCRLAKKLPSLLKAFPVTVVYPLPRQKWLVWVDPETGEALPKRRSSKTYGPLDALPELYWLIPLLGEPNLTVRLLFLDLVEYRLCNGWGNCGKRGSVRCDRIPLALGGEIWLRSPADYSVFLSGLPCPFTAKDLQKAGRLSSRGASSALKVLSAAGVLCQTGKRGRARLFAPSLPETPSCEAPGCKSRTDLL